MSIGACCPACGSRISRVVETRTDGDTIRRRRDCSVCRARWTTSEEVVEGTLVRPGEPLVRQEKSKPMRKTARKPAKPASAPRRQKTLDDIEAEYLNTDDDVRVALEGIGRGR